MMKTNDLALEAALKRKSKQTGFVHLNYGALDGPHDSIPLLENFCFVLALFRSRTIENVTEGKALLERLLEFQVGNNFPVYLHEYPSCYDSDLGSKIYPVIFYLLQDFSKIMNEALVGRLQTLLSGLSAPKASPNPSTPQEWAQFLLVAQLNRTSISRVFKVWDQNLGVYLGAQCQEKFEPAVSLLDLFMGSFFCTFSKRALMDHPIHLKGSLVYPLQEEVAGLFVESPLNQNTHSFEDRSIYSQILLWGDLNHAHSLSIESTGTLSVSKESFKVDLQEEFVEDEMSIALFCDAHPCTEVFVQSSKKESALSKATLFDIEDTVQIISGRTIIRIKFSIDSGVAHFCGHIFRSNRALQLHCKGANRFEAYDWKIALRTISRPRDCSIRVLIEKEIRQ